ncbi:MAG: hypothetical protein SFT81_00190 [Candidatus Caenarcaniphilales bacterium]|nr:hypothetical protein [Candidatus Caenarcaniphilales bacterium]
MGVGGLNDCNQPKVMTFGSGNHIQVGKQAGNQAEQSQIQSPIQGAQGVHLGAMPQGDASGVRQLGVG